MIGLLQIWHLALPVDGRAAALAAVLGAAGLIWNRRAILDDLRLRIGQRRTWAALAGLLPAAILLSNRAISAPAIHDTGLYHVPTVRWIEAYPVVPGLGNLHDRLAFNSAYLLYAALLDQGFWDGRAQHLAGGLLLLALFAQGIVSLGRLLRRDPAHRAADGFGALIGIAMLQQALLPDIASLSPDLPIFALTAVLTGQFLAFLEWRDGQGREANFAIFALVVPALIGVTVKLSFAAFAGALIPLTLAVWLRRASPERRKTLAWIGGAAALILVPWLARGVILSGYPAYPITAGALPVAWRVPEATAISQSDWIRSWARQPEARPEDTLNSWDWLRPWLDRLLLMYDVGAALCFACAAGVILLAGRVLRRVRPTGHGLWPVLLPPAVSLIAWFFTAPAYRFASGSIAALGAGSLVIALHGWRRPAGRRRAWIVPALLAALCLPLIAGFRWTGPGADGGFHPLPPADVQTFTTASGLVVYTPREGDQCWDAPLPCTPYPDAGLCLRQAETLQYGFVRCPGEG